MGQSAARAPFNHLRATFPRETIRGFFKGRWVAHETKQGCVAPLQGGGRGNRHPVAAARERLAGFLLLAGGALLRPMLANPAAPSRGAVAAAPLAGRAGRLFCAPAPAPLGGRGFLQGPREDGKNRFGTLLGRTAYAGSSDRMLAGRL